MRFQPALNKPFAPPHHPSSNDNSSTANKRKSTQQCFLPSTQRSQYQYRKANTYSILTINKLGPPVSESSIGSQKFMPPYDSERKFHKTGIKNWLLIELNLALITTTLYSTTNGKSFKVLCTHP